VLIAGLIIGSVAGVSLNDYLLRLFLPAIPALLEAIDLSRLHLGASRQKGQIEAAADKLWAIGVNDPHSVLLSDCRRLQDQTYRLRLDAPRVASWLYKLRRASAVSPK